jgi:5-methylcytosine-specific restriction endonuclease McrA
MTKACVVCGAVSDQARCPAHRYQRERSPRQRRQRQRVIQRDGYVCQNCGTPLTGGRDTQVDHVIPLAKQAGPRSDDGLRTLCAPCNERKGSR